MEAQQVDGFIHWYLSLFMERSEQGIVRRNLPCRIVRKLPVFFKRLISKTCF